MTFWLVIMGIAIPAVAADEMLPGPIQAKIIRVIDGDTVEAEANIWLGLRLMINIRLADYDTPELFRPRCAAEREKAQAARNWVAERLAAADPDAPASGPWPVELMDIRHGKFAGRAVARIRLRDGTDLGQILFDAGLARLSDTTADWCA
ncbi:MAG: nuclease [Alphaproteobacteria bacterium]|nr:nuclease [Alphaproteobacteria bacterium]